MMGASRAARSQQIAWLLLLWVLLAIRVPSLVQPAGGDQGLYVYSGQQWLAGGMPYRDMWDQKPPGIAFVYAVLSWIWPDQSVVSAADLAAAAATAWLLVIVGRRRFSGTVGYAAASVFLLFGDPSLHRLSGVYVRGQCEPFIALAVTSALAALAAPRRRRWHLVLAGTSLAAAVWLKYNAATYALPVALAAWAWGPERDRGFRNAIQDVIWVGLGFMTVTALVLAYFAANGAIRDFWLATIEYNLRYSHETYAGPASVPAYLVTFPVMRARVDMLWFLGGVGTLLLALQARSNRSALVVLAWLTAAVLSIAVNGQRDLPNYFVQANPALGLAAAAGIASALDRPRWIRYAIPVLLSAGLWRVGDEGPVGSFRWGGLPGLVENVRYDLAYARGRIDRGSYLSRFRGVKFDALEIDEVSRYVRETTSPSEPIYVFGFLGGSICWQSNRVSSSRFFWSRPILIEFAAGEPGYGSAGLLADLMRRPPAIVALQEEQWGSRTFFMKNAGLVHWLREGYDLDRQTAMFSLWRRKS